MLSYDDAIEVILNTVEPLSPVECSLSEALGRVLAQDVEARWDLPPADNSAMDGFAFAQTGQGSGAQLTVSDFIPAGGRFDTPVAPGSAARIMTGAPLPEGADTVVPLEDVTEFPGGIRLGGTPKRGQHVRRRGEELQRGEVILTAGTPLYAAEIALLGAAGAERVKVHPAPRAAVLSTGDELVELGEKPAPGQIINSNAPYLAARLREEGCTVLPLGIASDSAEDTEEKMRRGLEADLLVSTGGVSVGDRDYVQPVLHDLGFRLGFWKVAIKPGKPVLFGTVGRRPVFGLPGNPAAAAATFELFVRPALRRLAGFTDPFHPPLSAILTSDIEGGEKRQRFLWGTLSAGDSECFFTPSPRQGSGQARSLQGAQALLPVAAGSPGLAKGERVRVIVFRLPEGRR